MGRELFGTDGIRGVAGEFPLDPLTVYAAGAALGAWSKRHSASPEVVIGMDTRESGPWIAAHVAGGLKHEGVKARFAGVTTTPGVAYLTRNDLFVAGVMISASHNPFQDNGIKVFGHTGFKLPDAEELELEKTIFQLRESGFHPAPEPLRPEPRLDERYLDFLASTFVNSLEGMRVVVDCGHGAASTLAPALLSRLGASVDAIGCAPDGRNINLGCGALHVEGVARRVVETGADVGFAFDGDADRCIAVSSSGAIVNGDAVLLVAARFLRHKGHLHGNDGQPAVVATVMSNLGLQRALEAEGIRLVRTGVGDKYVLEEMLRLGVQVGGEQSGHVIFLEHATTGDGLLTALRVLEVMAEEGRPLDELVAGMKVYPQLLVNVKVKNRKPLADLPTVQQVIRDVESELGSDGRVLVRFSGTEPLARVMVEGPSMQQVDSAANRIAVEIKTALGV
jgi:phosphoglucosamine mutase